MIEEEIKPKYNSSIILIKDGAVEEIPLSILGEIFFLFIVAIDKILTKLEGLL